MSSSGDRTTSVWDRRKLAPGVKPLATAAANNTILSAYFSPAGRPPVPHVSAKTALEQSQQMNAKDMHALRKCYQVSLEDIRLGYPARMLVSTCCLQATRAS